MLKPPDDFLVVAFYTMLTGYESEVKKLVASLNKFGIPHDVQGVENLGSWALNTRHKARFLLQMIEEHPDKRMLYLDADAIVRKAPALLYDMKGVDIGAHIMGSELLSGTIYFEPNERVKKVFTTWARLDGVHQRRLEQINLYAAIRKHSKNLTFKKLPPEYTLIFDTGRRIYKTEPVMEHMQASRRLKREVNMEAVKCLMAQNQRQYILDRLPDDGTMLEWGCGGTTIWFCERLAPTQQLISIEHNAKWYKKVSDRLIPVKNWHGVFAKQHGTPGKNATKWEECPVGLNDYITKPFQLFQEDDPVPSVILVDGVARGACLMSALNLLRGSSGHHHIFIHDTQRDWYQWAMNQYPNEWVKVPPKPGQYPAMLSHTILSW